MSEVNIRTRKRLAAEAESLVRSAYDSSSLITHVHFALTMAFARGYDTYRRRLYKRRRKRRAS